MNDQLLIRREKMQALREEGIEPFQNGFVRTHLSATIHQEFDAFTKEEIEAKDETIVSVAGRIMTKRGKGRLALLTCRTVKAKFRFTCAKTWLGKRIMRSLSKRILGTLLA